MDGNTKNLCTFTVKGDVSGYYHFLKGYYGLADIATKVQELIDTTLEYKHPAWSDDIIVVTVKTWKNTKQKYLKQLRNWNKQATDSTHKNAKFSKKNNKIGGTQNKQTRSTTITVQTRSNQKINITKNANRAKVIVGSNTIPTQIH